MSPTLAERCRFLLEEEGRIESLQDLMPERDWDSHADDLSGSQNAAIDTPPETAADIVAQCDLILGLKIGGDLTTFVENLKAWASKHAA